MPFSCSSFSDSLTPPQGGSDVQQGSAFPFSSLGVQAARLHEGFLRRRESRVVRISLSPGGRWEGEGGLVCKEPSLVSCRPSFGTARGPSPTAGEEPVFVGAGLCACPPPFKDTGCPLKITPPLRGSRRSQAARRRLRRWGAQGHPRRWPLHPHLTPLPSRERKRKEEQADTQVRPYKNPRPWLICHARLDRGSSVFCFWSFSLSPGGRGLG